jgi:outer membrane protein OmpA-like peptidoglycan-associated protein
MEIPMKHFLHPFASTLLILLAGCASSGPPRPPDVDESTRRPINTTQAVELQMCRSSLQNTQISLEETRLFAQAACAQSSAGLALDRAGGARLARASADLTAPAPTGHSVEPNLIWTINFRFNSSAIETSTVHLEPMIEAAKKAAVVVLKGRTDGRAENMAESRIARNRAAAVLALLVKAGVAPGKIRTQYQPVGDYIADNTMAAGQAANRRVEIELYPVAPTWRSIDSPAKASEESAPVKVL